MTVLGHDTVPLTDPFSGWTVEIDVEMAPIISALWRLGIVTSECCQGYPPAMVPSVPGRIPAVICFPTVGRVDEFGTLWRHRFRKGGQWATRLAVLLADAASDDRWRSWEWQVREWESGSGLLLPNEDLPWLAAQLERIERTIACGDGGSA
jgi:hypothetical protein